MAQPTHFVRASRAVLVRKSSKVSFDRISWVPAKVTELTQRKVADPLYKIVQCLDLHRQAKMANYLETKLQKVMMDMPEPELAEVDAKLQTVEDVNLQNCIQVTLWCGQGPTFVVDSGCFSGIERAAERMVEYWTTMYDPVKHPHARFPIFTKDQWKAFLVEAQQTNGHNLHTRCVYLSGTNHYVMCTKFEVNPLWNFNTSKFRVC